MFVSQVVRFADVFTQVVKFKPVGLVIVVAEETDEFLIALANPNAWDCSRRWGIVREVAEDGFPL
jgi:hypothetical protein